MSKTTATAAPLDDVMLAMDVVDTLRHRQDLVARELDAGARKDKLIERLRTLYHNQGIEVPDHILMEGVAALEESRFAYDPPAPGLKTALARLYVTRGSWGRITLAVVVVAILGLGGYFLGYRPFVEAQQQAAQVELAETLPARMDALYQSIFEETKVQQAATEAEAILRRGKTAAAEGNRAGAEAAIADLTRIRDVLRQVYNLRVVGQPGVQSGFWTIPDINTEATNYYVVVEAVGDTGSVLELPVLNEENGETETVALWGLRVPEEVYRAVEADKRDDGVIQQNRVGRKDEGFLEVEYFIPVLGGAVTRW